MFAKKEVRFGGTWAMISESLKDVGARKTRRGSLERLGVRDFGGTTYPIENVIDGGDIELEPSGGFKIRTLDLLRDPGAKDKALDELPARGNTSENKMPSGVQSFGDLQYSVSSKKGDRQH
jgi:hypothetical protein